MKTWEEHMAAWQASAKRRAPQQLYQLAKDPLLLDVVASWDRVCPKGWNKRRPPRTTELAWAVAFQSLGLDNICERLAELQPDVHWPAHHAALVRAVNLQLVMPDGTLSQAAQGYLNKLATGIVGPATKKGVDTPE